MRQSFDLKSLKQQLKPFRLHWFPRLRSTSDHAAIMRKKGELFAPAVVLTGHQLAGRGRGSNTWWSGQGSITATFVLAADDHLSAHHIPLLAGLAARAAAVELTGDDSIQLKWPNDLLWNHSKLAGLLCERLHKVDLIGIGINANVRLLAVPQPLRQRVTSLNLIAKTDIDPTRVVLTLARHLHRLLAHRDDQTFAAALLEYDRHHALLGRRVTVLQSPGEPAITGICQGLDGSGRLVLQHKATTFKVIAGQVSMW